MDFFNRKKDKTPPPPPTNPSTNLNIDSNFVFNTTPTTNTNTYSNNYSNTYTNSNTNQYSQPETVSYGFQNQLYNQNNFGQGFNPNPRGQPIQPQSQSIIQGQGNSYGYKIQPEEQVYTYNDAPRQMERQFVAGGFGEQFATGGGYHQQQSYGGWEQQRVQQPKPQTQQQGGSGNGWDSWGLPQQQQQVYGGRTGWQQPPQVVQQATEHYTNPSWQQQQQQPQQQPQPLQPSQQQNIYPDLPDPRDVPQIKNQLGWVEQQVLQEVQKQDGQVTFISQIGNKSKSNIGKSKLSRTVNNNSGNGFRDGGDGSVIWSEAFMGAFGGFGGNQNQAPIANTNNIGLPPNFQNFCLSDFNINNMFFTPNKLFENRQVIHQFPSPYIKYKIIPYLDQKKVLDVVSVNDTRKKLKKNNLTIWDYHGGPNQLFYIEKQPDGYCFIINIARGFALQIADNTANSEEPIRAQPLIKNDWQKWKLEALSHGSYGIISKVSGKWLDLYHQKESNGTPVIQWDRTDGKNQRWRIVPA